MPKRGTSDRKFQTVRLTDNAMEGAPQEEWVDTIRSSVNFLNDFVERSSVKESGLKLSQLSDVQIAEITVQVPDPWINMTLENSWTSTGACKYMKRDDGVVEIRYNITAGVSNQFATLPLQFAPAEDLFLYSWGIGIATATFTNVLTDGSLFVYSTDDHKASVSYLAKDSTPIPLSCWPKLVATNLKPAGVVVVDVRDDETSQPLPTRAGNVVWELTSVGGVSQIKLLNIPWLPYNRRCKVKLLIFGE